jgi:hypothetical protein
MVQPVDSLSTFFSLPMDAQGPQNDQVVGQDEFGRLIYQGQNGSRYVMTERPRMDMSNALAYAVDNPWETAKGVAGAIVEGAWNGIEAPGNALRGETLTYGNVADTALDWGVMGAVGRAPEGSLRIFAGRNAQTADNAALEAAQRMAGEGASRDEIWRNTGWFQGVDGQWRFEIDDAGSQMKPYASQQAGNSIDLDDGFSHLDLRRAYPEAFDATGVRMRYEEGAPGGYFRPRNPSGGTVRDYIGVTGPQTGDMADTRSTTLHELQHYVQNREGFAQGASPENALSGGGEVAQFDWARRAYEASQGDNDLLRELGFDVPASTATPNWDDLPRRQQLEWLERGRDRAYHHTAGEVEARNVENRLRLTPEQRRATPPWETQDVPDTDQIVRFGSQEDNALSRLEAYLNQ